MSREPVRTSFDEAIEHISGVKTIDTGEVGEIGVEIGIEGDLYEYICDFTHYFGTGELVKNMKYICEKVGYEVGVRPLNYPENETLFLKNAVFEINSSIHP